MAHEESVPTDAPALTAKPVAPWLWGLLNLPFGVTSGFVGVTLAYILSDAGLPDSTVAGLVAFNLLPHTWKFFWSPIADVTLTRKRWYTIGNLISTATIVAIAFTPIEKGSLDALRALVFFNSLAITVVGMAVEGLMAHATPPEQQGRAAGWFQAGNLGGSGIGGGIALLLAKHVSTEAAFLTIAALLAACQIVLRFVPETPRAPLAGGFGARFGRAFLDVVKDLWAMLASRRGVVAVFLVFLPIGSSAAIGLFSPMAKTWHASASLVAITSGLLGGGASVVGCLVGGWMSDRLGRRDAYILSGLILAAIAAAAALAPRNPVTYTAFVLSYQLGSGIAYGCFTGFVLAVIGKGAVATKYNALASLSNVPIWYMTLVDGWAADHHGQVNMLYVDGASEIAGVLLLLLVIAIARPPRDEA